MSPYNARKLIANILNKNIENFKLNGHKYKITLMYYIIKS